MTTAHEQYYTEPEAGPRFVSYEAMDTLLRRITSGYEMTHADKQFYEFADQQDFYVCRNCTEKKGFHWNAGPYYGSDSLHWEGDFYILDEDGLETLCEPCYDEITAEPDYGPEPDHDEPLTTLEPQTRAFITFANDLLRLV